MNDPLTVPARDGIEAQRGHNDIFPGDPYPVADQLKRGLEALRKQVSGRGRISSLEVFALTDPLMDILSRVSPASPPSHDAELLAAREALEAIIGVVATIDDHIKLDEAIAKLDEALDIARAAIAPAASQEGQ